MNATPYYPAVTFIACILTTFGFLYYAVVQAGTEKNNIGIIFTTYVAVWTFILFLLGSRGFFTQFEMPPRLILFLLIPLALIIILFSREKTRNFIARMPITTLTYIHIVRVPVEIVLWWLYAHGVVSEAMTFQGVNYDIISGISAPFAGLFLVGLRSKSRLAAITWNLIAMVLLFNIVITAIRATPYFFDPYVFDQPNLAVFHFPYVMLPLFIVPAVLFCHIASLYQLIARRLKDD